MRYDDDLTMLGLKYGTDKAEGHWYTPHYHKRFVELRDQPITLLEIGVGGYDAPHLGGPSLQMWRDYFPKGQIVGVDIERKDLDLGDRIAIEQGDITDRRVVARLAETYGPFDIVIDDGSHRCDDVIAAWAYLWEHVTPEGWYVIEDLQTAYWEEYGGSSKRSGDTTIGWLYGLINHIHYTELDIASYVVTKYDETLVGLEIARNIAFIRKGDNTAPSTTMPPHPHNVFHHESVSKVTTE